MEILIPVVFVFFLVGIRRLIDKQIIPSASYVNSPYVFGSTFTANA